MMISVRMHLKAVQVLFPPMVSISVVVRAGGGHEKSCQGCISETVR